MQGLLQEFVQHMENMAAQDLIEDLGANCNNVWWDYRDGSRAFFKDFTEQDKVTCKIMSAALTFMGTIRAGGQLGDTRNEGDKDMRQILGCMVMHVFASILTHTPCADTSTGINYAWTATTRVDAGFALTPGAGALATGICEKTGWHGLTIGSGQISKAVDAWLSHNTELWTKLRKLHGNENCPRNQSRTDALPTTTGKVGKGAGAMGTGGIGKEIVNVVTEVFDKMKEDVIEKTSSTPEIPGAGKGSKHAILWAEFRKYMEADDTGTMKGLCDAHLGTENNGTGDEKESAICELTLKALHFKHGIDLAGAPPRADYTDEETKQIDLYMRCILVNIFMKKIMGMNCLNRPGGQFAFSLADGVLEGFINMKVGNIACEEKDAGEGGIPGVKAKDRTFWQIMTRWFERNQLKLHDGDWGVLGRECKVDRTARKDAGTKEVGDVKQKIIDKMNKVGDDMTRKVEEILPQVRTCTDKTCVKRILEQKKQEHATSRSRTPGVQQAAGSPGPQATTPPSSSGTPVDLGPAPHAPAGKDREEKAPTRPQPPDVNIPKVQQPKKSLPKNDPAAQPGAKSNVANPAPAKPAPATPVDSDGNATTPVATSKPQTPSSSGTTTEDDCEWQPILNDKRRQVYVVQNYNVSYRASRNSRQEKSGAREFIYGVHASMSVSLVLRGRV
ncbi:hypothetical protein AK88_00941 [Plasmodium fragile]|uniref:Schizont-infected cell agglutination extracellular alpha domain-containing protein n=1 Tax=Plasmodium fragile TaxID=5857 RepID=A0A0D9QTU8_PLAFR|nr:uncharacterized protein AK88_00941 [Plasmodium fragile]KJP89281.1 hypothetical protein AK88_00941 [Plasmodium fragile]